MVSLLVCSLVFSMVFCGSLNGLYYGFVWFATGFYCTFLGFTGGCDHMFSTSAVPMWLTF